MSRRVLSFAFSSVLLRLLLLESGSSSIGSRVVRRFLKKKNVEIIGPAVLEIWKRPLYVRTCTARRAVAPTATHGNA